MDKLQRLRKIAGAFSDAADSFATNTVANAINLGGPVGLAQTGGSLYGMLRPTEVTKQELKGFGGDKANLAFVPGIGGYRMARRRRAQLGDEKVPNGTARMLGEQLGPGTAVLAAGLLGAAAGAGVGMISTTQQQIPGSNMQPVGLGALVGAGTGMGLASLGTLAGALAALIKRRRTKAEQREHDLNGSYAADWLVPGVGIYNAWKAVGRQIGDEEGR